MTSLSGDLITVDGRDALRFRRRLPHAVERVWRALSEPAELAQWFVAPVDWGPTEGETREVAGQTMTVGEVRPPRHLAWSWGDEHYAFDLDDVGDDETATLLTFTHVFVTTHGPGDQHAAGWETYLDRLGALLDSWPISEEEAHDPIVGYHEAYVAKFGADPAPGRRMIASLSFRDLTLEGDVARLQRRYKHGVDRLWRAFTEPAELQAWFPETQEYVIKEAQEPSLIRATWWEEPLKIELRPLGDDTVLVFEHTLSDLPAAARTAAGWDRCFFALEALLCGQPISRETSLEHWPTVHERYAAAFGCDPEIGRAAFAQATVDDA